MLLFTKRHTEMFKRFFLNHDYELEYTGDCLYKGEKLTLEGDTIDLEINGSIHTFDREHIGLYTHYQFNPFVVAFDNVWFAKVDSKVMGFICGHLPVFKKPVEVGFGFRLIPGFSQYAINETCDVISYRTGNYLKTNINAYGYPYVSIHDPDKNSWRDVAIHILFARTFIENDDPSNKVYVNHDDGNKLNCTPKNLEWVTPKGNSTHAIATGLSNPSASRECTVHDLLTGESKDYLTVTRALKAINLTSNYYGKTKLVNGQVQPRVYARRYVITDKGKVSGVMSTISGHAAGRTPNKGPYQALNVVSKEVIVGQTHKELASITNVPHDHIRVIVESPVPKTSGGYYFRVESDEPWPDVFTDLVSLKPRSFEIENIENGDVLRFTSCRKVATYLSSTPTTINLKVSGDGIYKGWHIRELT